MIARNPASASSVLPHVAKAPLDLARPSAFLVPAAVRLAAQAGALASSTAHKDSFSVVPQELALNKMADALSLAHIATLQAPVSAGRKAVPQFVLLFDFDHTLSTEDSGEKLARDHGIANPAAIFARMRQGDPSVRPGGELAAAWPRPRNLPP